MKIYSNARRDATITDWPSGRYRTTAHFQTEKTMMGERIVRTTIDPKTGTPCAPKKLTYAQIARIVDGDDGRTYLLTFTASGHLTVMRSDMKLQEESIFDRDERFSTLLAMLQNS